MACTRRQASVYARRSLMGALRKTRRRGAPATRQPSRGTSWTSRKRRASEIAWSASSTLATCSCSACKRSAAADPPGKPARTPRTPAGVAAPLTPAAPGSIKPLQQKHAREQVYTSGALCGVQQSCHGRIGRGHTTHVVRRGGQRHRQKMLALQRCPRNAQKRPRQVSGLHARTYGACWRRTVGAVPVDATAAQAAPIPTQLDPVPRGMAMRRRPHRPCERTGTLAPTVVAEPGTRAVPSCDEAYCVIDLSRSRSPSIGRVEASALS